eukprot:6456415-Alexandrium_andersonii.AAC.1
MALHGPPLSINGCSWSAPRVSASLKMVGAVPRASSSQCEQGAHAVRCQPSYASMPVDSADVALRSVYVWASQRVRAP